ncbi:MAG: A/G-specific adenine glycosylase [Veillonellales bacterium]
MLLAEKLLKWYRKCGRKLPWRGETDPYKIWVSEIMLQQTRVEMVKPYYERWMKRFPTLPELARAEEEEVIRFWQGLGYYSRARNLLQGVREVQAAYGGQVPANRSEIMGLSGIGEYTAGAVLSIAYGQAEPAIDGNVLRVFSRVYGIWEDVTLPAGKRLIRQLVEREMPADCPGNFNQALMDLGAAVCIPRVPRCQDCPLAEMCVAQLQNLQQRLPVKKKKAPPRIVFIVAGVICCGDRFLLRRRPDKGLLAGMWEFPAVEVSRAEDGAQKLPITIDTNLNQKITVGKLLFQLSHTFSHRQWEMSFYRCRLEQESPLPDTVPAGWFTRKDWPQLSFAGPHRKAARWLLTGNEQLEIFAQKKG